MRRLQVWISATHAFESPQQYTVSGNGDCRFAQQFRMPAMPLSSSDHIRAFIKSDRSAITSAVAMKRAVVSVAMKWKINFPVFLSTSSSSSWLESELFSTQRQWLYDINIFRNTLCACVFALVPMECHNNLQFTHDCHYPSQMNVRVQIGGCALSICQANDLMRRWWCLVNR